MTISNKHITKIIVNISEVVAGWIKFRIIAGDIIYEESFSHVFDPIIDLKNWLETLTTDVQQTSFTFNPEGYEIRFSILKSTNHDCFIISEPYTKEKVFVKTAVNRKQMVSEFYNGILSFVQSDNYNPDEWELKYYKEKLCEDFKMNENQLIRVLVKLRRDELIETIVEANPMNIEVSKDYNEWDIKSKEVFIKEVLNEKISSYGGVKLSEFKSDIIEKYLDKE
jgi:hypothetical protein